MFGESGEENASHWNAILCVRFRTGAVIVDYLLL